MNLHSLETPCLLLDRAILESNIERLQRRLAGAGVPLRPHLKTTKCIDIARLMIKGQPGGVTVSTLAEAERFGAAGFRDILYAVAIAPNKLAHAAAITRSGVELTLLIDSMEAAAAVGARARDEGITIPVLLEVDVDGHRSGVSRAPADLVPLYRAIEGICGLALRGLITHAGSSYDCTSVSGIEGVAELERSTMVRAAEALRQAGSPCPIVSVGSSPAALTAKSYAGVTEVRAGVFAFNDLTQVRLGVARETDIAISVLTSVIGHHAAGRRIIVDAGWMALTQEFLLDGNARTYGRVCDAGGQPIDDLVVSAVNQEHGIVTRLDRSPIDSAVFPIGTPLRILPVHACSTAAAHDRYHVLNHTGDIVAEWRRFGGWTLD